MCAVALLAGCSVIGPSNLKQSRLSYNEAIKTTSEEEMLLNIVRLRYTDTPSSLQVTNIAAQFELIKTLGITPFFVAAGTDAPNTSASLLPYGAVSGADRPTFSLTPLDDSDFVRRLFTPLSLEGTIYLARTTWPIQTVFRLYLENLNWVPNGEMASGPTPTQPPEYREFLSGIGALQTLQAQGRARFNAEERLEPVGGPVGADTIDADDVVRAAKEGFEQALSFASHGVEVAAEHLQRGVARTTPGVDGKPFDWREVMDGLSRVSQGTERPKNAHVAVPYRGYWFYIDEADQDSKVTFALLMELAGWSCRDGRDVSRS